MADFTSACKIRIFENGLRL